MQGNWKSRLAGILRNNLAIFKLRLKALEASVAEALP